MQQRCTQCQWNYPEQYLNPMSVNGEWTQPICGICALELSNLVHASKRTEFSGTIAEKLRQMAVRWREGHPELAPTTTKTVPSAPTTTE